MVRVCRRWQEKTPVRTPTNGSWMQSARGAPSWLSAAPHRYLLELQQHKPGLSGHSSLLFRSKGAPCCTSTSAQSNRAQHSVPNTSPTSPALQSI